VGGTPLSVALVSGFQSNPPSAAIARQEPPTTATAILTRIQRGMSALDQALKLGVALKQLV
jgi:hypothetical protein